MKETDSCEKKTIFLVSLSPFFFSCSGGVEFEFECQRVPPRYKICQLHYFISLFSKPSLKKQLNLLVAPPFSIGLLCICDNAANSHKRMPGMLQLMKRDILIFSVV